MSKRRTFKMSLMLLSFCLLGLTIGLAAESAAAAPDSLTRLQSGRLIEAIGIQRGTLTEGDKDRFGESKTRSTWSKAFRTQEDGTQKVSVMVEHAEGGKLTSERHEWTFKPTNEQKTKWEFVEDNLVDSWQSLQRFDGEQSYFSFESMNFNRDGLSLTSGPGEVIQNLVGGVPASMIILADGLRYEYGPPEQSNFDARYFDDVHRVLADHSDLKKDILFDPMFVRVRCDEETCASLLEEMFTGLKSDGDHTLKLGTFRMAAGAAGLADKGARAQRAIWEDYSDARKENGFAGFRSPPREGNRYWDVQIYRSADHSIGLQYDNWEGFEVQFYVSGLGLMYGYYTDETLAQSSPYELELRDDKQTRDFEVEAVKGEVDVALEDPERIEGDLQFRLIAKRDLNKLPFAIINNTGNINDQNERTSLFVNALQLDGEDLTIARFGPGGLAKLPRTIHAGEAMNVRIKYSTRAMRKLNPSFTSVSRGGWMPFVSFGDMIPEFQLTMRYPSQYKLLGIGKKRSKVTKDGVTTATWKVDRPAVFVSFTLGKYIEDQPKIEAIKLDGTVIPVTVHVDQTSTNQSGGGGRGIRVKQLRAIGQSAVNSLNIFREISGVDYPYGELNLVADPQGFLYGQAPSSLIYLGFGVFRGEGTIAGSSSGRASGTNLSKFLKSVVAHEVGHQWWGATITNANSRNYWFVETLAEYFSALWLEEVYGRKEYMEQVEEWRAQILNRPNLASVQNASSSFSGGSYQALVYNKGPYAFHMLREIFGDEKFHPMMKKFSQELAAKGEIVTRDIQMVAEEALGGIDADGNPFKSDLGWFFDQWIRQISIPEYRFEYTVRDTEDGGAIISGTIKQRMMAGEPSRRVQVSAEDFRAKVPITVLGKDKKEYSIPVIVEGDETPFRFKVPSKPLKVTLNKYMETLAYDVVIDN